MIVQVAPTTIIRPPRRKIEKFTFRSPKQPALIGSTNQATSASPAPVWTARSGTPSSAQDRDEAEDHERDPEAERDRVLARRTPATTSSAPSSDAERARAPSGAARFSGGRLRQVADRA